MNHLIFLGKLYRKNAHLFLLNMAIADLTITVIYMPRMIVMYGVGRWWYVKGTFGLILCRIVPFLHHVSILVSVLTILGATVDRFCAIMFPLRSIITRKVACGISIATWLGSAAVRFPYLITATLEPQGSYFVCNTNLIVLFGTDQRIYERALFSIYSACLLTTISLDIIVIIKLKRLKTPGTPNIRATARKNQASKKLLKMMIAITLCFILCWFVYFFAFDIFERPLNCYVRLVRFILAHANSALNPFIVLFFDVNFRVSFKKFSLRIFKFGRKSKVNIFDRNSYEIQGKTSPNKSFVELDQGCLQTYVKTNYIEAMQL